VPFVVDEHPVNALGPCCAYPYLGVAIPVRARRPRRGLHCFRPSLAKISSKAVLNLASRSRTRQRKEPVSWPRSMARLRATPAGKGRGRPSRHAQLPTRPPAVTGRQRRSRRAPLARQRPRPGGWLCGPAHRASQADGTRPARGKAGHACHQPRSTPPPSRRRPGRPNRPALVPPPGRSREELR
jgi:hypothetical protein